MAGEVALRKRDSEKAAVAVSRMTRLAGVQFFPLTFESAESAGKLARRHFLRGADAVYCQLARDKKAPLITYDMEIGDRAQGVINVFSPTFWLARQRS